MKIIHSANHPNPIWGTSPRGGKDEVGFADLLKGMLAAADGLQKQADDATTAFVLGHGTVELHDVVLASERARLALDLTVAVRNKLIEAYQEIMRMQI